MCGRVRLGYDPTIMRIPTILNEEKRKPNEINSTEPNSNTGGATRVFEAHEKGGSSKTRVALKDRWMGMKLLSEGDTLKNAFQAMEECIAPSGTGTYRQYSLMTDTDGVV